MKNFRKGSGSISNTGEDIHTAARNGDLQTVQTISLSNPLSVNLRDKHSRTPLHLAAWAGQAEVVSFLCKNKADVGAAAMDDMGAIHFASQKGHVEVVRILVQSGVSVKASNRKGFTPLHYAVQGSHLELTKYLVRKGAHLSAKTKTGKTPLDLASNEEIRSFLVEQETAKKPEEMEEEKNVEESTSTKLHKDENGNSGDQAEVNDEENSGEKTMKRKGAEADTERSSGGPKKPRVTLNHLLTEDDLEENAVDEEEEKGETEKLSS
ncbi:hypothetical protein H6P81_005751 [Aristolochia fimbriata]|uniref:Uncharacterized protein n=1 Tax=Aristolochia fimbriata TaxID=158543 RepID=A0AAV7EYW8_ARIFI|nr:hypothetical protein H6P81_005751 [Aristolochia fimbriata]